jgi:hypothetical protein
LNLVVVRFDCVRLLRATPPATPARAAPPASRGVFAFDASSTTFPPALPTGPFDELDRPFEFARVPPAREFVRFGLLDEPFRLVARVDFEPVRRERVLDDRVVCAMVSRHSSASMPAALFALAVKRGFTHLARI